MSNSEQPNPFSVRTPEDLTAGEATRLFVDVFSDFHKIREVGHAMINGARGTGKSMMFRYLLPDCQRLEKGCRLDELPNLGVLVSVKNTNPNITELSRLMDSQANVLLNEHFLVMFTASRLFHMLSASVMEEEVDADEVRGFYYESFLRRLNLAGNEAAWPLKKKLVAGKIFGQLGTVCDELYNQVISYLRPLAFTTERPPYVGALCGYLDFLVPLVRDLQGLTALPSGPVYLLIDDADYLNEVQTRILNSWIATRTSANISIKVSTAFNYKTYHTLFGTRIDSPHDYSEINVSDIYTTTRGRYLRRVEEIVRRRLEAVGISVAPRDFFPEDVEQERAIKSIADRLRQEWSTSGKGYRPSDDAVRYARPQYIAQLKGPRKAGSSYSYAGFEHLVHVSSGVVRFLLESAALMFNEQRSSVKGRVEFIAPGIQDGVLRQQSEALMFHEFEKMFRDYALATGQPEADNADDVKLRLQNLLRLLGMIFHLKLISEDSERRVFSVAFSDSPPRDLVELFNLGVQLGYFQKSTIGNKDGTGRTPLYVLTRRLAPHFFLDPTGFAGYLFVTSDKILEGIRDPEAFLRKLKGEGTASAFEEGQLRLFG